MNNELIERIDEELERIRAEEDAFESLEGSVMHIARDIERRKSLWNDCKAALTQQLEAEPALTLTTDLVGMVEPAWFGKLHRGDKLYADPPKPAAQPTMDDAIAAGDGTLHGAIDYWQERALKAEAAQPQVQENIKKEIVVLMNSISESSLTDPVIVPMDHWNTLVRTINLLLTAAKEPS